MAGRSIADVFWRVLHVNDCLVELLKFVDGSIKKCKLTEDGGGAVRVIAI